MLTTEFTTEKQLTKLTLSKNFWFRADVLMRHAFQLAQLLNKDYYERTGKKDLQFYVEFPTKDYIKVMETYDGKTQVHCQIDIKTSELKTPSKTAVVAKLLDYDHTAKFYVLDLHELMQNCDFTSDYLFSQVHNNRSLGKLAYERHFYSKLN